MLINIKEAECYKSLFDYLQNEHNLLLTISEMDEVIIHSLNVVNSDCFKKEGNQVTRFEVIDHKANGKGRILVEREVKVEVSIQDDGKTMKVFLTDIKD